MKPIRTSCRTCGKPVLLAKNGNTGNVQPLDPTPNLDGPGNIVLLGQGRETVCMVVPSATLADGGHRYLYTAHQTTCAAVRPASATKEIQF